LNIKLSNTELRVIGCLLEKESTTPDQYPLSLNALTNACNQKSNRDPVMALDESTVQETLDALSKKHLVVEKSPFGGRTAKYQHRFCNTEFSDLQFSTQQRGLLCVLFLRGPQTPGELRTRTNRLCEFSDVNEVEEVLDGLASHKGGVFVKKLPRQPGKRESRYIHLFGETDFVDAYAHDDETVRDKAHEISPSTNYEQRIEQLEKEIVDLRSELAELKNTVKQLS
jgi:uncharacterized protein YceH (UPF0502 family)